MHIPYTLNHNKKQQQQQQRQIFADYVNWNIYTFWQYVIRCVLRSLRQIDCATELIKLYVVVCIFFFRLSICHFTYPSICVPTSRFAIMVSVMHCTPRDRLMNPLDWIIFEIIANWHHHGLITMLQAFTWNCYHSHLVQPSSSTKVWICLSCFTAIGNWMGCSRQFKLQSSNV